MTKVGGMLLLSLGVSVSACGGSVTSSADSGTDSDVNDSEGGKDVSQSGTDACTQQFCIGTCIENYHYVYPVINGCVVCSCAPDDDAGDGGTDTSDGDAGDSCINALFADPEAGADAGRQTLTPEDVACMTTADCAVQSCGDCCPGSGIVFGVNKSSAFACPVLLCPPPSNQCSPSFWTQDCGFANALTDVEVACVNYQCRTFATLPDASAPGDAQGGD